MVYGEKRINSTVVSGTSGSALDVTGGSHVFGVVLYWMGVCVCGVGYVNAAKRGHTREISQKDRGNISHRGRSPRCRMMEMV